MDESKLELKVGALLLAALVSGLVLLSLMGELNFGTGHTVSVDFSHTGNVVKGAPVKLGGVVVGRVDGIELLATRRDGLGEALPVKMTLNISTDAAGALRTDAQVTVSSQGPLGEPYLELWPGSAPGVHDPNVSIRGLDSPRIDIVTNRLAHFLDAAGKLLENNPDALANLVTGVGSLTRTVDGVLTDNREDFKQLTTELAAAARDLRAVSALARRQLEPGGQTSTLLDDAASSARVLKADLPELSKKASVALGGLAAVSGKLTDEDGERLKSMIARYQQAGEKLDALASRAERLTAKLEAGEGTMGALMKDPQAYDDLKSLLADLRKHPWKMLWKE
jgi:phospholipid/cholesterol/gamma-HCH transport system substrate-binding protein